MKITLPTKSQLSIYKQLSTTSLKPPNIFKIRGLKWISNNSSPFIGYDIE
jgi:hypothetical protein